MGAPRLALARAFGARVRELRRARGMKQKELAARAWVDSGYLCRVEAGQKMPSLDLALRLRVGLRCSLDELLGGLEPVWVESDDQHAEVA